MGGGSLDRATPHLVDGLFVKVDAFGADVIIATPNRMWAARRAERTDRQHLRIGHPKNLKMRVRERFRDNADLIACSSITFAKCSTSARARARLLRAGKSQQVFPAQ